MSKSDLVDRIDLDKEWCMRMAQLEADAEIGAGPLAIDPVFDGDALPGEATEETSVAFSRFSQNDALIRAIGKL